MIIDNYTIINVRTFKDYKDKVFYIKPFKLNIANPLLFFYMRLARKGTKQNDI
jgi:hypothetical protein